MARWPRGGAGPGCLKRDTRRCSTRQPPPGPHPGRGQTSRRTCAQRGARLGATRIGSCLEGPRRRAPGRAASAAERGIPSASLKHSRPATRSGEKRRGRSGPRPAAWVGGEVGATDISAQGAAGPHGPEALRPLGAQRFLPGPAHGGGPAARGPPPARRARVWRVLSPPGGRGAAQSPGRAAAPGFLPAVRDRGPGLPRPPSRSSTAPDPE